MLLKCLIAYDKRSHIDHLYNRLKDHEHTGSVALIHDAKKAGQVYSAYNSNEFIRDIVLHAINSDEIILVLQLINKYKIILGLYCIHITEAIINCLEEQFDEETQITYPLEKLLVIEAVCARFAADSSSVIKFLRLYQQLATQPDDINFVVNYYNPLRMYVTLQRVARVMLNSVGTGGNAFQSLVDAYEELILKIIDEVDVSSVIRNWLLDEAGESYKVIDYLAQFDCLNIISHVKVLKVCEQIWYGTYDILQNYGIKDTVKKSAAITTFTTFNVKMDTAASNFGSGHWFNTIYYAYKSSITFKKILKDVKSNTKQGVVNLQNRRKLRTANFRVATWMENMYDTFTWDIVYFLFMFFVGYYFAIQLSGYSRPLYGNMEQIVALQAQAQTTAVTAEINSRYNQLQEDGENFIFWYQAIYLYFLFHSITMICKD